MQKLQGLTVEGTFPGFITPEIHIDKRHLARILEDNKTAIEERLLHHGGLVFRNFPVESAKEFSDFIETLNYGKFVSYIGGDSPRDKVEKEVYTSTEAPPSFHIPLHQELSYIKYSPRHIYFFCEIAPVDGGATIIADARKVYHALDTNVRKRFEDKGLTYISHYYYRDKLMTLINKYKRSHKSWVDVFETENKKEVEKKCIDNEFSWCWLPNDWIEIQQTRPASMEHPLTQERVWHNQAHLYDFNPRLLGWKNYLAASLLYIKKSTRLHEIRFADGSMVPREDLYHILDVLDKNTVSFPWQQGDVMVLDNVLAMHGRAPFSGKRRILTALTS